MSDSLDGKARNGDRDGQSTGLFRYPSSTSVLFILLILALVVATVFEVVNPASEAYLSALLIEDALVPYPPLLEWAFTIPGFVLKFLLFPIIGLLAFLILIIKPQRLRRRYEFQDLAAKYPDLDSRFARLAQEMALTQNLRFVWSPRQTNEAFVFRYRGQYQVCFTEGLIQGLRGREEQLEAIAAHELGHIANGDVFRIEIAEALTSAYFATWLILALYQIAGSIVMNRIFHEYGLARDLSFLPSFLFLGIIYFLMNALSRARQMYADARVTALGRGFDLRQALLWLATAGATSRLAEANGFKRLGIGASGVIFRVIPLPQAAKHWLLIPDPPLLERVSAIEDPSMLSRPSLLISFSTGFIAYRIVGMMPLSAIPQAILIFVLSFVLLALNLISLMQRQGSHALTPAKRGGILGLHTAGWGAGIILGQLLSAYATALASSLPLPLKTAESVLKMEGLYTPSLFPLDLLKAHDLWLVLWLSLALFFSLIVSLAWKQNWFENTFRLSSRALQHPGLGRGSLALLVPIVVGSFLFPANAKVQSAYQFSRGHQYQFKPLPPFPLQCPPYCTVETIDPQLEEAAREYQKAIKTNPNFIWPYVRLSHVYLVQAKFPEAIEILTQALRHGGGPIVHVSRAIGYLAQGNSEQATKDYTRAIELASEDPLPYYLRGRAYERTERYEEALKDHTQAMNLDPTDIEVYCRKAKVLESLGEDEKAVQDLSKAIDIVGDYEAFTSWEGEQADWDFARYLRQYMRNLEDDVLHHAAGLYPLYPYFSIAMLITGQEPTPSMEGTRIPTWSIDPASVYFDRGRLYYKLGDYDKALDDLTKVVEWDPHGERAYLLRGNVYLEMGDYERAEEDFTRIIAEAIEMEKRGTDLSTLLDRPLYAQAFLDRGRARGLQGKHQEAVEDLTKAIVLEPNEATAYCMRSRPLYNLKQYDQAIADLKKCIALKPYSQLLIIAYGNLGWYCFVKGDLEAAIEASDKALELDPSQAWISYNLGLALLAKGNYSEAASQYAIAIATTQQKEEIEVAVDDLRTYLLPYSSLKPQVEEMIQVLEQAKARKFG